MQSASRDRIVHGRRPGSLVIYAGPDPLAISTSARPCDLPRRRRAAGPVSSPLMWLSRRASMNGMRILGIVAAFVLCACSDRLSTTRAERDAALAADI